MEKNLILTCDAGTTGCKCTLTDGRGMAIVSSRRSYDTVYPQPGWAEQNPDTIINAVYAAIREVLQQVSAQRIACVGLSGTMNGCIAVDAEGRVLHPNILHSDSRSELQVDQICAVIPPEEFYRLTGNRPDAHYTLPKIMWLRDNKPEVYEKARWFLNIKDYLYGHLTGRFGYTDYSDASLTTALDINRREWAVDLLKNLDLDPERMPKILASHDIRGRITRNTYRLTGLIAGTPVAIGGGDGACTGRGAGVNEPGSGYCYIGSSAWVSQILDKPLQDPKARILHYLDLDGQSCHATGTVQCGAAAFDWALKNLLGSEGRPSDISAVENMARQIQPGAEGVLFLPTLMGWRTPYWDANTRGCLMGFTLYHDRRHIARAVYEGVAFALKSCAAVMDECGASMHSMMLAGGGAKSGLWPDILASIFGLTARVHKTPGETTSLGAAIAAGVGIGLFQGYAEAASVVSARSTHVPNPAWQKVYPEVYAIYADIYERIRPLNDRISILKIGE